VSKFDTHPSRELRSTPQLKPASSSSTARSATRPRTKVAILPPKAREVDPHVAANRSPALAPTENPQQTLGPNRHRFQRRLIHRLSRPPPQPGGPRPSPLKPRNLIPITKSAPVSPHPAATQHRTSIHASSHNTITSPMKKPPYKPAPSRGMDGSTTNHIGAVTLIRGTPLL